MTTLFRGLGLTAILLLTVACGGSAAPASTAADAPPATTASEDQPAGAPAAADADAGAGDVAGATALTITGARDFTVSTPGSCSISQLLGTDDYSVSFETDGDDFWLLNLDVRKYAGPGEYEIVDSEIVGKAFAHLTDMMGGGSDSIDGTLTIGEGGTSGSVAATLDGDAGTMELSGTFACEMV